MKNCFELAGHGLKCEALWKAVLCGGAVYPWRHEYVRVRRGPGCWGYEIRLDAGGYVMERGGPVYLEQGFRRVMDDPGDVLEYIAVSPGGGLDCVRYIALEEGDEIAWRELEQELSWDETDGGVCVRACRPAETVVIPARAGGRAVVRVELGPDSLTEVCRRLVISEGVKEACLDFSASRGLERLDIPERLALLEAPAGYYMTNWFRRRRWEQVYLNGWYLGTPGGMELTGADGLAIEPGTLAVAPGADFKCPWRSIAVPGSVRSIGRSAFADAPRLERLSLPEGVELGENAFECCPLLQNPPRGGK